MCAEQDDDFVLSDAIEPPREHLQEILQTAQQRASAAQPPLPPPPRWPLVSGVFHFPWYQDTLGVWLASCFGLTLCWLGILLLFGPVMAVGPMAVYPVGMSVATFSLLVFSYVATCCRHVIQETCIGQDVVDDWPTGDWREWIFSLMTVGYLVVLSALAAQAVRLAMAPLVDTWLPGLGLAFVMFPLLLISSLEADSPWLPYSGVVLRSLVQVWMHWLAFYFVAAVMLGGWCAAAVFGIWISPWLSGLLLGPALATILLILARLLGRVAWSAAQHVEEDDGG